MQPCQLDYDGRDDMLLFLKDHADAALHATQHLARDCSYAYGVARTIGLSHSVSERFARFCLKRPPMARSAMELCASGRRRLAKKSHSCREEYGSGLDGLMGTSDTHDAELVAAKGARELRSAWTGERAPRPYTGWSGGRHIL